VVLPGAVTQLPALEMSVRVNKKSATNFENKNDMENVMKRVMFLILLLTMTSAVFGQAGSPARQTLGPSKIEPRPTPGKAPITPKELPAKPKITSLVYVDTLPGARITIKNLGGKPSLSTFLIIELYAAEKHNGKWPDISGPNSDPYLVPVYCPWDAQPIGTTSLAGLLVPTLEGRVFAPEINGGGTLTLDVKFNSVRGKTVNLTSLVDFTLQNNCRPRSMGSKPWSDYKYFIKAVLIDGSTAKDHVRAGAFLHP